VRECEAPRIWRLLFSITASIFVAFVDSACAYDDFSVKGYCKNLLSVSENASSESILSDLNRVRLELRGKINSRLSGKLILDNELWTGNVLKTEAFRQQKDAPRLTFFDHGLTVADNSGVFNRLLTHRAFLSFDYGSGSVVAGQQRIAWGTAKLWNPTDLFNPYNPITLERDERLGVDAIRLEQVIGPLSKAVAAYAPGAISSKSSGAAKYMTHLHGYDLSVMGGIFHDRVAVGGDFAGSIKDVGIHGEGVVAFDEKSEIQPGFVVGGEYAFPNSFYFLVEYYYNGAGKADSRDYETARLLVGEIVSLGRHYLGGLAGYDFSGVLRGEFYGIYNITDGSAFLQALLRYSLLTNLDWSIGSQVFVGNSAGEYGAPHKFYYTQVQWYF